MTPRSINSLTKEEVDVKRIGKQLQMKNNLTAYLNRIPQKERAEKKNYILGNSYTTLEDLLKGLQNDDDQFSMLQTMKNYTSTHKLRFWDKLSFGIEYVNLLDILNQRNHVYDETNVSKLLKSKTSSFGELRDAYVETLIQIEDESESKNENKLKETSKHLYNRLVTMQLAGYFNKCKPLMEKTNSSTCKLLKFISVKHLTELERLMTTNYEKNLEVKWGNLIKNTYITNSENKTLDDLKLDGLEGCMFVRRLFGYRTKVEKKIEERSKAAVRYVGNLSSVKDYDTKLLYMYYTTVQLGTFSESFKPFLEQVKQDIKTFDDLKSKIEEFKKEKKRLEEQKKKSEEQNKKLQTDNEEQKRISDEAIGNIGDQLAENLEQTEQLKKIKENLKSVSSGLQECTSNLSSKSEELNALLKKNKEYKENEETLCKDLKSLKEMYTSLFFDANVRYLLKDIQKDDLTIEHLNLLRSLYKKGVLKYPRIKTENNYNEYDAIRVTKKTYQAMKVISQSEFSDYFKGIGDVLNEADDTKLDQIVHRIVYSNAKSTHYNKMFNLYHLGQYLELKDDQKGIINGTLDLNIDEDILKKQYEKDYVKDVYFEDLLKKDISDKNPDEFKQILYYYGHPVPAFVKSLCSYQISKEVNKYTRLLIDAIKYSVDTKTFERQWKEFKQGDGCELILEQRSTQFSTQGAALTLCNSENTELTAKLEEEKKNYEELKESHKKDKLGSMLKCRKRVLASRAFNMWKESSVGSLPSSQSPATSSSQEDYSEMTIKEINSIQDPAERKKAVSARLGYWSNKFNKITFTS